MKKGQLIPILTTLLVLSTCLMLPITSSAKPTIVRIGVIFPSILWQENYQPVFEEIIEPDINDYIDRLPNLRFKPNLDIEFLYEVAQLDELHAPDPALHREKVQYFKSIGVDLIIGGFYSSQAAQSVEYMTDNEMLLFSPSSTAPQLASPDDALYRLAPADDKQAQTMAEMIISQGVTDLTVIQVNDDVGDCLYDAFETIYKEKGGNIHQILLDPLTPDYAWYIDQAEAYAIGGDDGVLLLTYAFQAVELLFEASSHTNVYSLPWFGWESLAMSESILSNAGDEAAHVALLSTYAAPDRSIKYQEMIPRYAALTDWLFNLYAANIIDAALIITQAVLETKPSFNVPFDVADIIEVLPDVASRYYGYSGWCLLNEFGDRAIANYEIWGYGFVGIDPDFEYFGWYDMRTDTVYWD